MDHATFAGLCEAMERRWRTTRAKDPVAAAIAAGRAYFKKLGRPCAPVGNGDAKTASAGTYGPIGLTCPPACPYMDNGCYAQQGNCALHEARANALAEARINAAGVAMVAGALELKRARLHVTGDGALPDGRPDIAYWDGLARVARWVRVRYGGGGAWTYTHIDRALFAPLHGWLDEAGVFVRFSDSWEWGGAIALPFEMFRDFKRETGTRAAKCPAQLRDTNCAECKLCWERPDLVIVFDPHGPQARLITDASPAVRWLRQRGSPHDRNLRDVATAHARWLRLRRVQWRSLLGDADR